MYTNGFWFIYKYFLPKYSSKQMERFARGLIANLPHFPKKTYSSLKVWL